MTWALESPKMAFAKVLLLLIAEWSSSLLVWGLNIFTKIRIFTQVVKYIVWRLAIIQFYCTRKIDRFDVESKLQC